MEKDPREFSDTSSYPQDGYGNTIYDQEERLETDMEDELDDEDLSVVVDNRNGSFNTSICNSD